VAALPSQLDKLVKYYLNCVLLLKRKTKYIITATETVCHLQSYTQMLTNTDVVTWATWPDSLHKTFISHCQLPTVRETPCLQQICQIDLNECLVIVSNFFPSISIKAAMSDVDKCISYWIWSMLPKRINSHSLNTVQSCNWIQKTYSVTISMHTTPLLKTKACGEFFKPNELGSSLHKFYCYLNHHTSASIVNILTTQCNNNKNDNVMNTMTRIDVIL
jgi:hypothetical protein